MKIAVITGASAGIGREFVRAVDREERFDEIWVIARRLERLEALAAECRNPIRPVVLDLADLKNVEEYRALLEREQPEIGLLINAAGCGVFGPFAEKDLKKQLDSATLNSLALTAMCHVSLPYMREGADRQYGFQLRLAAGALPDRLRRQQELCAELLPFPGAGAQAPQNPSAPAGSRRSSSRWPTTTTISATSTAGTVPRRSPCRR